MGVKYIDGDRLAVRILLSKGSEAQKQAALTEAAQRFRAHVTGDMPCPNCGSGDGDHEDNGLASTSYTFTLLCTACGHQWSPNEG